MAPGISCGILTRNLGIKSKEDIPHDGVWAVEGSEIPRVGNKYVCVYNIGHFMFITTLIKDNEIVLKKLIYRNYKEDKNKAGYRPYYFIIYYF